MPVFEVDLCAGAVSVVVPAYNAERFIRRALDSILAQTHPPNQVIVVDDGSTDKTHEIVATEYADRVTLIRQQQNGGPSKARNAGLLIATGEFIAFLDTDDYWEPNKIGEQLRVLAEHPEASGNYTGLRIVGEAGEHIIDLRPPDHTTLREVLRWCNPGIPASAMLLRRSALEKLQFGFDQRQRGSEDWNLWCRLIAQGPFCVSPEPLTCYQTGTGDLKNNADHMYSDFMKMLESVLLADLHGIRRAIWRRRIVSYQSFKACITARDAGDTLRERAYMMKSVADWPSPFWAPERFRHFAVTAMRS